VFFLCAVLHTLMVLSDWSAAAAMLKSHLLCSCVAEPAEGWLASAACQHEQAMPSWYCCPAVLRRFGCNTMLLHTLELASCRCVTVHLSAAMSCLCAWPLLLINFGVTRVLSVLGPHCGGSCDDSEQLGFCIEAGR
jgi:hypothetical protein